MAQLDRRALIVSAAALAGGFGAAGLGAAGAARAEVALPDDMALGSPKARVTMVEYASASCPHCAHWTLTVLPAIRRRYIDTGKVRLVLREILTQPAEVAAAGFLIARRAGKDRYFAVLEDFFRSHEEIFAEGANPPAIYHRIGRNAGLTDAQVDAALAEGPSIEALNARVEKNVEVGKIEGTPTFVINGVTFDGDPDTQGISAALDRALAGRK